MEPKLIIAQIIGIVAAAIAIFSFQCRESKKLFYLQMAATLLFSVHFLLLEAYTGLLLNIMGLVRAFFLSQEDKKWARHPASLVILTSLMGVCGIATWEGWISLLPTIAMVVGTPFLWTRNGRTLRLAQLFLISPCWLVYNAIVFSIAGVITESFNMISVVISFCRFGIKNLSNHIEKEIEN